MTRVYKHVLPDVRAQLQDWRKIAERIPDQELRKQALSSMTSKQFHCEGGAVYAAANLNKKNILIPLIVAFQTISDYLDNLCDRSTSLDEQDFRMLHQAMQDAVNPAEPLHDYYAYREEKEDGDYLTRLVKTCQTCICMLPSYGKAAPAIQELVSLYCDLQVYKHIHNDLREQKLLDWWQLHQIHFPDIRWNEFAAATGSTLGVFMLFLAASVPDLTEQRVRTIKKAYFPYICSLHILLDYLIDQAEDQIGGDLNFCNYYENPEETIQRIAYIAGEARERSKQMQDPPFHRMIIEGLLALYLSDPKVRAQKQVRHISRQLMKKSPIMRLFFLINTIWIRKKSS